MGRPKKAMPEYRFHVSGQAVVTLSGRTYYLGEHNSPESRARYLSLLQTYNENGLRMPDEVPTQQREAALTVECVTAEFREYAEKKYKSNKSHLNRMLSLCNLLDDEYGNTPAAEFGPRKLSAIRDLFVASGNSRGYANCQTRNIAYIFKHAVSRELVPPTVVVALKSLEALKRGQTTAPEPKKQQPVDLAIVRATAEYLSPTVVAMIRVQVATGARPSEICRIRTMDIDRSGEDWIYRPPEHKTAGYGIDKAIPIVGDAREALTPYLTDREPDAYCFSPKESAQWHRDQRTAQRKTPPNQGNKIGTNRKEKPTREPGDKYTSCSYRKAIQRAAKKAKVDQWAPYRIRHTAATAIREALGIEAVQAALGHTSISTSQIYAKQKEHQAIRAAKAAPKLGLDDAKDNPAE